MIRWKKGERVCWTDVYGDVQVGTVERYVRIRGQSMVQIRKPNGAVAHEPDGRLDHAPREPDGAA